MVEKITHVCGNEAGFMVDSYDNKTPAGIYYYE
jgi:hypothetical protein